MPSMDRNSVAPCGGWAAAKGSGLALAVHKDARLAGALNVRLAERNHARRRITVRRTNGSSNVKGSAVLRLTTLRPNGTVATLGTHGTTRNIR
jgi:hypothetical protein